LSSRTVRGMRLMATPINAPAAGEIWHLSIEDLFAPVQTASRLGGDGPFVINLSVSTAPISIPTKPFAGCADAHVYQIQVTEDGRMRYRLRLGPFASEDEADAILAEVRETYPGALTATAGPADLRTIGSLQAKIDSRQKKTEAHAAKALDSVPSDISIDLALPTSVTMPAAPTPQRAAPAPAPVASAPKRAAPTPAPVASAPKRAAPTPAPAAPTPQRAAPTPAPVASAPKRATPTPARAAPTPQRAAPTPQRAAPTPAPRATPTPQHAEPAPVTVALDLAPPPPTTLPPLDLDPEWALPLLQGKAAPATAPAPAAKVAAAPVTAPAPAAKVAAAPVTAPAPAAKVAAAPVTAPAPAAKVAAAPVTAPAPAAKAAATPAPAPAPKAPPVPVIPVLTEEASKVELPVLTAIVAADVATVIPVVAPVVTQVVAPKPAAQAPIDEPPLMAQVVTEILGAVPDVAKAPEPQTVAPKPPAPIAGASLATELAQAIAQAPKLPSIKMPTTKAHPSKAHPPKVHSPKVHSSKASRAPVAADKPAPVLTQSTQSSPTHKALVSKILARAVKSSKLTSLQHVVVGTAPAPVARDVKQLSKPLDDVESTQTIRALSSVELEDEEGSRWYVIELALADTPFDPDSVPNLDIFSEYRLYSVAGVDEGRTVHALRLGFFSEEIGAVAVASYLAAHYEKPNIKRVSIAERERFAHHRVEARKDVAETGTHAAIEITDELVARRKRTTKSAPNAEKSGQSGAWHSPFLAR
jgi:hypothetical protein